MSTKKSPGLSWAIKVSFFGLCSKMQIIPIKKLNIKTCFIQFLWFFRVKCWFKGQIISRIHLSLPYSKLLCFDKNINGNRDVKFFECDYWSLHWRKNITLWPYLRGKKWNHFSQCFKIKGLHFVKGRPALLDANHWKKVCPSFWKLVSTTWQLTFFGQL